MKILYRPLDDPASTLENRGLKVEELRLPEEILLQVKSDLQSSNGVMPTTARKIQDWNVGFLDRRWYCSSKLPNLLHHKLIRTTDISSKYQLQPFRSSWLRHLHRQSLFGLFPKSLPLGGRLCIDAGRDVGLPSCETAAIQARPYCRVTLCGEKPSARAKVVIVIRR